MSEQDDLQDLWTGDLHADNAGCGAPISELRPRSREFGYQEGSLDEMMATVDRKARELDRKIRMRNAREWVAGGAMALFFGWAATRAPDLFTRAGDALVALACAWIVFYLFRHGRFRIDHGLTLSEYTEALAAQYDGQIRLLRSAKYWYLLPIYLGLLVITAGPIAGAASRDALRWTYFVLPAICTALFAALWWLNEVVAVHRLQSEKDKLLSSLGE